MKKVFIFLLLVLIVGTIYYGESRRCVCLGDKKCVTVWKTYNNECYIIQGRYYGLFIPSLNDTYIETTNTAVGVDLLWEKPNLIIAQIGDDATIYNSKSNEIKIIDYKADFVHNDSLYTYFDNKIKLRRYKKDVKVLSIPINEMGAL